MGEDKLGPGSRKESLTPCEAQANRIMEDYNHQNYGANWKKNHPQL
jgi:hypothetical protein